MLVLLSGMLGSTSAVGLGSAAGGGHAGAKAAAAAREGATDVAAALVDWYLELHDSGGFVGWLFAERWR
ncbi:hypothetical protein FOA52_006020 [Chlamydomonas sp. UWO 241]|nr:hypothetical protein FOA52_006020 [Chlamydomonas sp. UWO 241]